MKASGIRFARLGLIRAAPFLSNDEASRLRASEFRVIPAEDLTANSPYTWYHPVVTLTAISGDGSTIAGNVQDIGVDYDCAAYVCGIAPVTWSWDSELPPSQITAEVPLFFESHTSRAYPRFMNALSFDGKASLVVSEFRHYETAIYRNDQPNLLRPNAVPQQWLSGAGMSADGSVVIRNLGATPFRWEESNGLTTVEGLPTGFAFTASKVSGDGRMAVLNAQPGFTHGGVLLDLNTPRGNAFSWTEETGLTELPQLPGDEFSTAHAASFDGSAVVGTSNIIVNHSLRGRAIRWENGDLSRLAPLAGFEWSTALDVSANGQLVVGEAYNATSETGRFEPLRLNNSSETTSISPFSPPSEEPPSQAVVWNGIGEVFDLKNLLVTRHGLAPQLEGWLLTTASLISDDGFTIAGRGIGPNGISEAWVLRLDRPLVAPEPSSVALLLIGVALAIRRRRLS